MSSNYWTRRWNRRRFVGGAGVVGLGAVGMGLVGCGDDDDANDSDPSDDATSTSAPGRPTSSGTNSDLIPAGIGEFYPLIEKYHWSKSTVSPNPPKYGGRLQLRLLFDTASWDPFDPGTAAVQNVPMIIFYNRLLQPNLSVTDAMAGKGNLFNLDLKGDLADSWEQPSDTEYVFNLNENAAWFDIAPADGRRLTSEDVLYTYEAYLNERPPAQADIFRDVLSFEAPDESTFKITTKKPIAYLINELSAPLAFVINPEVREAGMLNQDPPIGSGPFVMKEHKYRNTMNVDKNPNYFKEGRPYLDGIDYSWSLDQTAAIAAYETGKFDTFMYVNAGGFATVDKILDTMGWSYEGGDTDLIVQQQNNGGDPTSRFRVDKKPFDDVRVRRALSMALDRDKQLLTISGGLDKGRLSVGYPTDWIAPDDKPWPPPSSDFPEWFTYNPEKAKALLADAGYEDGDMKIELLASSGTAVADPRLALIQEDWKAVGIDCEIKLIDSVALNSMYYSGELGENQVVASISAPSGMDLDDFTYRSMRSGAVNNQIGVNDPELDKLLDAQQSEFDREARKQLGREIFQRDHDQVYNLRQVTTLFWEFKRPYLQNWISHDVYMFTNGWGMHVAEDTWLDV